MFSSTLTVYVGQLVNWNNALMVPASSFTVAGTPGNTCAILVTSDGTQLPSNTVMPMSGLWLLGPQANVSTGGYTLSNASTLDGLCVYAGSGTIDNFQLNQSQIVGFRHNLAFVGPNIYIVSINNTRLTAGWRDNVLLNLGSNAGERILFVGDNK